MAARTRISLDDSSKWIFRQADDPDSKWLGVHSMPTNVHVDLLHNGIIADPSLGKQENDCQWIGETAWIYRGTFPTPKLSSRQKAVLAFDGLDTYATVVLNGTEILKTKDMFIPERVDITCNLEPEEENILEITFESTYLIGKKLVEQYPDHRWGCWNGDPSRLAVRKAQFHYGWDWGPALFSCGPWRPISLEIYNSRISDLYFTTDIEKSLESAEVVAKADIEGEAEEIRFEVSLDGVIVGRETVEVEKSFACAAFKARKPKLWYPHTYGKQPLYVLSATLLQKKTVLDTASKRFGLRRAELIQRKLDDAPGSTFLFEINNIPIFCGGSNWIPAHSFTCLVGSQRYRDWVKMAVKGNQVMLRAWGGGIFEEKAFYEACDEMGVLVWQDFLFACGNYPANPEFLDLVRREATENVKLLRHYPSIVIWAGNNEDYQYRETENLDYDPTDQDPKSWLRSTFPARYIYEKILKDVTTELLPGTYYHFGSPYGGKDTTDPHVGDIHQWNVWHGTQERYQDFDKMTGRFVSEFGMEAFPDMTTIDHYLLEGKLDIDRYPQSSTVDFHNKAAGHERRLALYLAENIPYTLEPFEQFVYCTQLMQAECVSTAYKLWKRQWKGPGREYCSGALVWQLDDCWPGTSWSIIDHHLRPKMAYYAIKRELQPISIGMKRTVETIPADKYTRAYTKKVHKIQLWACNLSLESCDATVSVHTYNLITGQQNTWPKLTTSIQLLPNRTTELSEFVMPTFRSQSAHHIANAAADSLLPSIFKSEAEDEEEQQTVIAAYLSSTSENQIARAVNWPEPLKHVHFPKNTNVELELVSRPNGEGDPLERSPQAANMVVMLKADVPVKGVALEVVDGVEGKQKVVFEDNGVDLMPGEKVSVGVEGLGVGDEKFLRARYLGM